MAFLSWAGADLAFLLGWSLVTVSTVIPHQPQNHVTVCAALPHFRDLWCVGVFGYPVQVDVQ
jgi:hypothetical protein